MTARVPRPSNQFGYQSQADPKSCQWTIRFSWGWENTTTYGGSAHQLGYRDTPKPGPMYGNFRGPTPWFALADRWIDHGADYSSSNTPGGYPTYSKKGNESAYICCCSRGNSPWEVGSKSVSIPSHLSNSSLSQALERLRSQNVDLGVMFGEANKTLEHIAVSIRRLYWIYYLARRGRWSVLRKMFPKNPSKGAANGWLEFQYGWLPLMSDLYGLQQQLKEGFRKEGFLIRAIGQAQEPWPAKDALPITPVDFFDGVTSGKGEYLSRTVIYSVIEDSKLYALNQLGLINPALIAWELVPLSFVVDWILPIGDLIGSLTAAVGTSFVAGFEDRIASGDWTATGSYRYRVKGTPGKIQRRVFAFERRVYSTLPLPGLYMGSGLNMTKALSALALFRQRA